MAPPTLGKLNVSSRSAHRHDLLEKLDAALGILFPDARAALGVAGKDLQGGELRAVRDRVADVKPLVYLRAHTPYVVSAERFPDREIPARLRVEPEVEEQVDRVAGIWGVESPTRVLCVGLQNSIRSVSG